MAYQLYKMRGYISHNYGKSGAKYYKCSINVRAPEGSEKSWEWKRITGFTPYRQQDLNVAQLLRALPEHEYVEVTYYEKVREFEADGEKRSNTENIVTNVEKVERAEQAQQ